MKKYILLLFWGITLTSNAQLINLPVTIVNNYPNRKNWCAAATAECVLRYNKINIDQCAIMDYVRLELDRMTYGNDWCCFSSSTSPHPCDKGVALGYDYEIASVNNVLMHYGNGKLFSSAYKGVLLEASITTQLSLFGQPIIAQWDVWDGAHAVVICGKKDGKIQFMDPNYSEIQSLPYEKFKEDKDHEWDGYLVPWSPYNFHCFDCERNYDEEGIDCGGRSCPPCKTTPSDLCSNCILDEGEETIDCGGTCPSCRYIGGVTDEITITNTTELRSEIMAFKKITAGLATTVASGQEVSFITKETGSIVLRPGFTAENGSEFRTQMKDLSQYERLCGAICPDHHHLSRTHKVFINFDVLTIYNLNSAVNIGYNIYKSSGWAPDPIYSNNRNIDSNGNFVLWNCTDGTVYPTGIVSYYIKYSIEYCKGPLYLATHNFTVDYSYYKSLTENSEDPETPPQFSLPDPNNTSLETATAPPQFTITPNPNPGTFQLQTNFPFSDIAHLKIINSIGATLYETQTLSSHTIQLPTSATGQHFVVIMLKDGAMLTQKMVIQR